MMVRSKHIRRGMTTLQIVLIVLGVLAVIVVSCAGLTIALVLPAIGKAREAALGIKSSAQLSQIETSREIYANDYRDSDEPQPQFTLDLLVAEEYITADLTASPRGPVADGGGDYWVNPILMPDDEHGSPGELRIASYDRAMYETSSEIAVCYYIEPCELVDVSEFQRLMDLPINAETDFNLPPRQ